MTNSKTQKALEFIKQRYQHESLHIIIDHEYIEFDGVNISMRHGNVYNGDEFVCIPIKLPGTSDLIFLLNGYGDEETTDLTHDVVNILRSLSTPTHRFVYVRERHFVNHDDEFVIDKIEDKAWLEEEHKKLIDIDALVKESVPCRSEIQGVEEMLDIMARRLINSI